MVIMKKSKSGNDVREKSRKKLEASLSEDEAALDSNALEIIADLEEIIEPAPKKIKTDVTKEAEKELRSYNDVIQDPNVDINDKLSKMSSYLEFIFENNVNTLEFETNFNEWIKSTLLILLEQSRVASVEFYQYLCNVLKVAPTIVEPTCEKILTFIYNSHQFSAECNTAFENFMESLSYTFEKLRRYPKLIAKLLCSVRDNINGVSGTEGSKFMKKMLGFKSKDKELFILPKLFLESYTSIISMLPHGQIMDLWKTLQHNLDEECIRKYKSSETTAKCFLKVVVELAVAFLCSIKVADYSVPTSTVEKVEEMMRKLKEISIPELISLQPSEYDSIFTSSLLKLCNTWAHLNHFISLYNENYKSPLPNNVDTFEQAMDLSFMFPQLSSDAWLTMWNDIEENKDIHSSSFFVSLVSLKLKYLAQLHQKREIVEDSERKNEDIKMEEGDHVTNDLLQRNLQELAKFLWDHQHTLTTAQQNHTFSNSCEDTLRIATSFLEQDELIKYAKAFLENNISISSHVEMQNFQQQLSSNMAFRVAVVLESLDEGLKRIGKSSYMKRHVKKFSIEFLNPDCKIKVLNSLKLKGSQINVDDLKKSMMNAVKIVNEVILMDANDDFENSVGLLQGIISLIGHEELAQYPRNVKTTILLSVLLMFAALVKDVDSHEIMDELSCVLSECGRNSQGNDVLFHVKWIELFMSIKNNAAHLSEKATKSLCSLTLENIYISPKTSTEFGTIYIKSVCDNNFDLSSRDGYLTVCVLDYILQEQTVKGITAKSNRSAPILVDHAKDLSSKLIKTLSDGSIITDLHSLIQPMRRSKRKSLGKTSNENSEQSNLYVSGIMQACYLLLKGKSHMTPEDLSEYNDIVLPYLQFALDYLEVSVGSMSKTLLHLCVQFLLEALRSFEGYRAKLPEDFLARVWNSSCAAYEEDKKSSDSSSLKTILEVANEAEFQSICDSMIERMVLGTRTKLALMAHFFKSLISAETANEKKPIRRATIELGMFKYLQHINSWKETDDVVQVAVPYIQFQTLLLKRRMPMCNLSTLAISMSSITSVPLDKLESIDSFKIVFSQICDLLNALSFYRLDVLSFRSHVFLQCFQFLVECLIKRANQNNKVSDTEIFDLRYCAHCIERVCQSAKLGREELSRIAPYLIVILMRQFEKITIYPVVKNPLLNGCHKLLDMCADQGISHVNSMLAAGSREIFKAVYELYKKFYRYKGKV